MEVFVLAALQAVHRVTIDVITRYDDDGDGDSYDYDYDESRNFGFTEISNRAHICSVQ